jgi:hypothetical protein
MKFNLQVRGNICMRSSTRNLVPTIPIPHSTSRTRILQTVHSLPLKNKINLVIIPTVTFKTVSLAVLTAVTLKMAVFWVVAPCRLLSVYRRFRGLYCLHHQGDELSLVNSYQTTRRYNPWQPFSTFTSAWYILTDLHTTFQDMAQLPYPGHCRQDNRCIILLTLFSRLLRTADIKPGAIWILTCVFI